MSDSTRDDDDDTLGVGRFRLRGTTLEILETAHDDEVAIVEEEFDLGEWTATLEFLRRPGCAFTSAAVVGAATFGAIGTRPAVWIPLALVALFFALATYVCLVRKPYLVLRKNGEEERFLVSSSNASMEELFVFFAAVMSVGKGGAADEEGDELERHPDENYYRPHALVLNDGRIAFALTCDDVPQLLECAQIVYRRTVDLIREGREGWKGPILFKVNPSMPKRTDAGFAALEQCLEDCRVWASYGGAVIDVSADWSDGPDDDDDDDGGDDDDEDER